MVDKLPLIVRVKQCEPTKTMTDGFWKIGAGRGNRTLDTQLGKLLLYH
jgi:hypothetical protein